MITEALRVYVGGGGVMGGWYTYSKYFCAL